MSHLLILASKGKIDGDKIINQYLCEDTGKTVFANRLRNTVSPFTGKPLKNVTVASAGKDIIITAAEAEEELNHIGDCDHCKTDLYVTESMNRELQARNSIYCPVCAMESDFEDAEETDDSESDNEDNYDDSVSEDDSEMDDSEMDDSEVEAFDSEMDDSEMEDSGSEDDNSEMSSDGESDDNADNMSEDSLDMPDPVDNSDTSFDDDPTAKYTTKVDDASSEDTSNDTMDDNEGDSLESLSSITIDLSKVLSNEQLQITPVNDSTALVSNKDDQPIGLLDAEKAENDNGTLFSKPEALEKAIAAVSKGNITIASLMPFGFVGLKVPVGLKKIVADEIANKIEEGIAPLRKQLDTAHEDAKADNAQAISIAAVAMTKRILPDLTNPVRDALIVAMTNNGMRGAETIVDTAFNAHGPEMVENVLKKADEISKQTEAERNVLAKVVAEAQVPVVASEISYIPNTKAAQALKDANLTSATPKAPDTTVVASDSNNTVKNKDYYKTIL